MNQSKWIPDSLYGVCSENGCPSVCSNEVYSPITKSFVHDSQVGKVFCPFGMDNSMNQSIFTDQQVLNTRITQTPWGRAPQLDPRPLTKVGLRWIVS